MIEAKKLANSDLIRYIGDPKFSKLPVETLLSKAHGAQRAKVINMSEPPVPLSRHTSTAIQIPAEVTHATSARSTRAATSCR